MLYLKRRKLLVLGKAETISTEAIKTNGLISVTTIGKWEGRRSVGLNNASNV